MKDIAIVGAGGFGRETAWLISQINQVKPVWNLVGFYDDAISTQTVSNLPVLGTIADLHDLTKDIAIVIAVGDPLIRRKIKRLITSEKISFPSLIHPSAQTGDASNQFGAGCIITSGCILTVNIIVGDFVVINLASTIGHDAVLESFCSIMPNCSISGFVHLGEACMVGAGARILQNVSIGAESLVGAGAVVTKDAAFGSKLIGIPAVNMSKHVERI